MSQRHTLVTMCDAPGCLAVVESHNVQDRHARSKVLYPHPPNRHDCTTCAEAGGLSIEPHECPVWISRIVESDDGSGPVFVDLCPLHARERMAAEDAEREVQHA